MSMEGTGATTLKGRQCAALRQMLGFNQPGVLGLNGPGASGAHSATPTSAPAWKLLLFDRVGQDILAPVMNVKQLREEGVTLHLNIHSDRDPVPDVPAIYFCQATDENLRRIGEDLRLQLYGSYYFNFISPISRQKLEDLAQAALQTQAVTQIQKVYDQYVNFISMESEMFCLRHQSSSALSYHALNKGSMVDGLFAVCVTLGTIPIIRCPKGNAAEAVATRLDKKLRENLRDARNSLFVSDGIQAGQYSFYRPLLVILDRQFDLATPLHHTWTYQALAHDVLNYSLNRVQITESTPSPMGGARSKSKTRSCDLDSKDAFWVKHKGSPFPLVAEKIQEELEDYRSKEEDIKLMKSEMALLEKKRLIDMHTSIATAILEQIKLRKLDVFFELEEKILSRQVTDKSLKDIFEDTEAGTPEDKLRIFLIYYLCAQQVNDQEIRELEDILEANGCDMAGVKYLQRWKSVTRMSQQTASASDYSGGGTKTVSMFSKLMTQGSSFVMEGVKNLVVKKHNLPVTKIVEELMEVRPGQHQDDFRYFDPKILRPTDNIPRAKNPFQEAIVFMVGGGNYIEYQNLMDYTQQAKSGVNLSSVGQQSMSSHGKRIIYGCSTLVNAKQMMQQLAELGHEMT
ncbi:hypothetical protein TCAL_06784, partial [Tigriopus californicus]|eukprot:TCALIF_06784-PA protein Name:"Similar to Slh Protein sly1 homolog (Drosophila melanogaster)" AED:0.12 eAED:0.12 QI:1/0/0/1/0.87/0.77/9/0/627